MSVFTRFRDIINSNINAMLDKAEDPAKMIRMMEREMEDTLVDLKSTCAAYIADKSRMNRERKAIEERLERWNERAELAVSKGRDDLAREAISSKREATRDLETIEKDIDHIGAITEETRSNIAELEDKLEQVKAKHRQLLQRGIHAAEKKKVNETLRRATGSDAFARFSALESKIERMEAEADLSQVKPSLEAQFRDLEQDNSIEDELQALKKSLSGSKNTKEKTETKQTEEKKK